MKEIYILEHFDFTNEQMDLLKSLGNIHYFEKANEKEIAEAIKQADVILLDWIDPNPILEKMIQGQFMCLPYTGYDWVKNVELAKRNGVIISTTPNYSTNAVAEHHLSLILDCAKHITTFNNLYKSDKKVPFTRGFELKDKKVGIIGLGNIGQRLAELLKGFGVKIISYSKTPKNIPEIQNVDLKSLLKDSDIICITCKLNLQTQNLIGIKELKLMKSNVILTSTTGGVINLDDLCEFMQNNKIFGVGLDDVDKQNVPQKLIEKDNFICTYHRAYDTDESEKNRINLCIENIKSFLNDNPINTI